MDEDIEITLSSNRKSWAGIGFANGKSVSMTGSGKGVDLYACVNGAVMQYWMVSKVPPKDGTPVAGSTCTHASGATTMTFKRSLAGSGPLSVPITPGTGQVIIYARGADGKTGLSFHGSDNGGKVIDVETLAASEAKKKSGETVLWLHLTFMIQAWGALLPWGVAFARLRQKLGAPTWFHLHRGFQSLGWLVMLLGFAMAVWHNEGNVGKHFQNGHALVGVTIVMIGFLQPFNALLRHSCEHREGGFSEQPLGRKAFEVVHKSLGYLALVAGLFNICYGIKLLVDQNYDTTIVFFAAGFAAFAIVPVFAYVVLAVLLKSDPCTTMFARLVGLQKRKDKDDEEALSC